VTIPIAQLQHDYFMEVAKSNECFARAMRIQAAIYLHPDQTDHAATTLAQRYAESAEAATLLALECRRDAAACLTEHPTQRIIA
jgi:hypothetical protein